MLASSLPRCYYNNLWREGGTDDSLYPASPLLIDIKFRKLLKASKQVIIVMEKQYFICCTDSKHFKKKTAYILSQA